MSETEPSVSERAARLRAEVDQDRADQLAIGLMEFADNMHIMAGQWPDNAAVRDAYQVAEQRARDLIAADRALENEPRPDPSRNAALTRVELRCDRCGRSTADTYGDMAAPVVFFVRQGLCHPCSRSTQASQ